MFSNSIFNTKEEFKKFNETIKKTKEIIKQKIEQYKNKPIIVLIGMMGAGKSSISCCLLRKNITIEAIGKSTHLVGEGIGIGIDACTTVPSINYDSENDLVIADLPGFEDNRDYKQELINSIAIDYLFEILPNYVKEYKIILVFTCFDLETNKGAVLINSFAILMKMFPNFDKIKNTFGIIITKGDNDFEPKDYIDPFIEKFKSTSKPNLQMQEIYQFFRLYQNNIFVFPKPLIENIGK